jgi:hypothetical protein
MKTHGEVEVNSMHSQFQQLIKVSVITFMLWLLYLNTHGTRGWVGPTADLDGVRNLWSCWGIEYKSSSLRPINLQTELSWLVSWMTHLVTFIT